MKILIDIGHPAHVHYFKNFINEMKQKNHVFMIIARNKEITFSLLKSYGITYKTRGTGNNTLLGKLFYIFKADSIITRYARKFKPDIFLSFGSAYAGHVAFLLRKPHIVFDDTEHAKIEHFMYKPFSNVILNPECFNKNMGSKQIHFNGYMELCYLHPKYFTPDPSILDLLGVEKDERYLIIRFVSWNASHDVGQSGLSLTMKRKAVKELSKYAKVFISSEGVLPEDLKKYEIKIPPEKMHNLLYYSSLYFGESGTMAVESAILGVPTVRISTLAKKLGNFVELQDTYDLLYFYDSGRDGLEKALEIIQKEDSKKKWQKKAKKLINNKIDVTQYMVYFIEQYISKG